MQTETAPAPLVLDFDAAREPASDAARKVLAHAEEKKAGRDRTTGIKGYLIGKSDVYEVGPYDLFVQPGWNTRDFSTAENQAHVLALAASIAERGVDQPLTAYVGEGGKLYLTDGESRLRAVHHAINVLGKQILSVPVRMEPRGSNDQTRVVGLLVKNSGKPLAPMEQAQVVRRLLGFKWDVAKIASEVGFTASYIRHLISLLELPGEMQAHVSAGAISATAAVRVTREAGNAAPALVEAAVAASNANGGKKAGRATRATLRAVQSARDDIPAPLTLPDLLKILKASAEDAIEQTNGDVEIRLSGDDWARITAAF